MGGGGTQSDSGRRAENERWCDRASVHACLPQSQAILQPRKGFVCILSAARPSSPRTTLANHQFDFFFFPGHILSTDKRRIPSPKSRHFGHASAPPLGLESLPFTKRMFASVCSLCSCSNAQACHCVTPATRLWWFGSLPNFGHCLFLSSTVDFR